MRILTPELSAPPDATFAKYTVTALELRRLLREARDRNESFTLTYTHLGLKGDEEWRRSSRGSRTVRLREDGKGRVECSICDFLSPAISSRLPGCACTSDELALLPPSGYWPNKLLIQQAYPIVKEAGSELVCFGP